MGVRFFMEKIYKFLNFIFTTLFVILISSFAVLFCLTRYIYPLKYKEQVLEYSQEFNVEAELVYAIIKTESGFKENAESSDKAKGLMQITDSTAEYISKKLQEVNYDIFDIVTNIRFGTYYISYLTERFDSVELAIVAYNAGEGKVKEWLNQTEYSKDGKSIQSIPYTESANYYKRICKNLNIYRKLYGKILDK